MSAVVSNRILWYSVEHSNIVKHSAHHFIMAVAYMGSTSMVKTKESALEDATSALILRNETRVNVCSANLWEVTVHFALRWQYRYVVTLSVISDNSGYPETAQLILSSTMGLWLNEHGMTRTWNHCVPVCAWPSSWQRKAGALTQ